LFIASDANPDALSEIAWRAGRKPARGGVPNLICIAEPLDTLATELAAVADRITIILPWGSLLRAVAAPELVSLRHIASLCRLDANVEIVLSYDEQRDARQGILSPAGAIDERHIATLPSLYREAGFQIMSTDRISQRELADYQTTWAKRLAFGRPRKVWRLRATYDGTSKK
jgi:16S rRNA (adenine(1408)-N(1))-methyltransferase